MQSQQERVEEIVKILRQNYPESRTTLKFKTPLQILVATILSAQCTDEKVNQITANLFKKYKTAADFAKANRKDFEEEIRSTGFFRNKARNIRNACQKIESDFSGNIPDNMNDLVSLPGVARKTANIVLSTAFQKAEGIAVDTHVRRLSWRLGLSKEKDPVKIEKDLMAIVPKSDWLDFNYMLLNHGRKVCQARKPDCAHCVLYKLCPSAEKFSSAGQRKGKDNI